MHSTATTAISLLARAPRPRQKTAVVRVFGLMIASLVPAIFWCAAIGLFANWLGFGLSMTTLGIIGGVVAVFLFAVCAPLLLMPSVTGQGARNEDVSP